MLAGLAWWGWQAVGGIGGRIALAILTPGLAAVLWGLLAAPRARIRLPLPGVLAVKAVAFGGASVAVYSIGHHALAIAFAAVAAVNTALAAMDRNALMVTRTGLPEAPEELNRRMAWKSWLNGASPSGTGRVTGAGRARGATE
jgi:hypothetical protein